MDIKKADIALIRFFQYFHEDQVAQRSLRMISGQGITKRAVAAIGRDMRTAKKAKQLADLME